MRRKLRLRRMPLLIPPILMMTLMMNLMTIEAAKWIITTVYYYTYMYLEFSFLWH